MILNYIDCYKIDHRRQYPKGTNLVFSNWTPRKAMFGDTDRVCFVGLQYFIKKYLVEEFEKFFNSSVDDICREYEKKVCKVLGVDTFDTTHIRALHELQYLPIAIRAIPEGTNGKVGYPSLVMWNTHPDFYWLVNYLETIMSATLWMPSTSATTARKYRKIFDKYQQETNNNDWLVPFQGHDFSFRGHSSLESACLSGIGHLVYFNGTDTYPAMDIVSEYYGQGDIAFMSVPATEHSVMCAHIADNEISTFEYLLDLYPKGIVSVVSDTWNLWKVLDEFLPKLKDKILSREGKLTIRGDSGDPVEITLKSIQKLWDVFGGTVNKQGYKELDTHIGWIYGDSITLDRQERILQGLKDLGFASSNVILGIGSFSYQYTTRDVYGHAMKATYCEVNGEPRNLFKDPVTDDGTKKSAKGLLTIHNRELKQECTWEDVYADENEMIEVFRNSFLLKEYTWKEVRENAKNS
jgi:nicotinamide phosphoribosyltransferase